MSGTSTRMDRERNGASVPDLSTYVGEWVVLQNDTVVGHGPDLEQIANQARALGIRRPRVVFVSPQDPGHAKLGL
jgi:Family of unknown function (DUF5678)